MKLKNLLEVDGSPDPITGELNNTPCDDCCPACNSSHDDPNNACDYEPCGYCDFDHTYEYEQAAAWHQENDPTNSIYETRSEPITGGKSVIDMLKSAPDESYEGEGFDFQGQTITNPFWDASGRFEVDPEAEYGDAFLNSSLAKRIKWEQKSASSPNAFTEFNSPDYAIVCSDCNVDSPGDGSMSDAEDAGWQDLGYEDRPAWKCPDCMRGNELNDESVSARTSGSGRPFEGKVSLKKLLETSTKSGRSWPPSPANDLPAGATPDWRGEGAPEKVEVCPLCGDNDPNCPACLDDHVGSFNEPCPRCGGENTESEEPIPSMMGYGTESALHCNDCDESFSADPLDGGYHVPKRVNEAPKRRNSKLGSGKNAGMTRPEASTSFDKFMNRIVLQEAAPKSVPDSLQRVRAARNQDRPMNRTFYGRKQ